MALALDNSIMKELLKEVEGYLPEMSGFLDSMRGDSSNLEGAEEFYRMAHTIKGASAMVKLSNLSKSAEIIEDILNDIKAGHQVWTPQLIDSMADTVQRFQEYCVVLHDAGNDGDDGEILLQKTEAAFEGLHCSSTVVDQESEDGDESRLFADEDDLADDLFQQLANDNGEDKAVDDLEDLFAELDSDGDDDARLNIFDLIDDDEDEDEIAVDPARDKAVDNKSDQPEMSALDRELLDIFNEEATEHLDNIGQQLNALSSSVSGATAIDEEKRETLHSIRRSVHTLKGAGAVIGIDSVAAWGHEFEDFLDWLHDDAEEVSPVIISAMFDGADILEQLAQDPAVEVENDIAITKELFLEIMGADAAEAAGEAITAPKPKQQPKPLMRLPRTADKQKEKIKTVRIGVDKIEKVMGLSGDMSINLSSFEDAMSQMQNNLSDFAITLQRLKGVASSLEAGYDLATIPHLGTDQTDRDDEVMDEFDPLEMDRYSELNILIRSLNEVVVDLDSISDQTSDIQGAWQRSVERQRRVLVDVQDTMKSIQMTPFSTLSNRMYKTVRESARTTGKSVRLVIEGGTIEMDTHVWDLLADPLMHMLRNSVDHGVESRDERITEGKAEQATIRINCSRRGSLFVLRLSDDGRGLDYEAIRRRAAQLYPDSGVEQMGNKELASLIFQQGFSVKSKVTTMSGRGVGMDVVKHAVDRLNGSIEVAPGEEQGLEFIFFLPITVAQLPALLVRFGCEQFAVPMRDISRVLRIDNQASKENEFELDGEMLPLLRPAGLMRLQPASFGAVQDENPLVLAVDVGGKQGILLTDGIIGKRDVVFKTLGAHLRQVPCVAGATIMGDGSLVPVLNTEDLFSDRLVSRQDSKAEMIHQEKPLDILIVDDSISIRKVLANVISSNGWNPTVAIDGVDALEKIREREPDCILLDIEMPRMNGFEVLQYLQSQSRYRDIPVLMLTSRSADKYRDKASKLGASGFVTKPFKDDELLALIVGLTG